MLELHWTLCRDRVKVALRQNTNIGSVTPKSIHLCLFVLSFSLSLSLAFFVSFLMPFFLCLPEDLKEDLDRYVREQLQPKVRLVRNLKREGLIRGRMIGASHATGTSWSTPPTLDCPPTTRFSFLRSPTCIHTLQIIRVGMGWVCNPLAWHMP